MYLAIDLGSTHFKASIFDENLNQLSICKSLLNYLPSSAIECQIDVNEVRKSLKYVIQKTISQANIFPKEIKAIGITSQAQTFVIIDKSGDPKTDFISWQDKRAVETARIMRESGEWSDFAEHSSFGWIYPGLQICLIKHIGSISKGDLVLKLPSFFTMELTGKPYLDNNLASMSGLYSLIENDWWQKALDFCNIEKSQLPSVCNIGEIAGKTGKNAANYGLIEGIPLVLAGNDQTAGAYGADINNSNSLLITLGTAQVAYQCVNEMPKPSEFIARGQYPQGLFYKMAVDNAGGSVIGWAKESLPEIDSYERFFELASDAPFDCNGLRFTFNEDLNCGEWLSEKSNHKISDYARSVIEYLCRRMKALITNMGVNLHDISVLCAGGGSNQKIWVDTLSVALNMPIKITEAEPLLGVAKMALQGVSK